LPGLFQFDPAFIHFEQINGELIFSADLDLPLIRYNIHDEGSVFTLEEMRTLVPDLNPQLIEKWPFPFVTLSRRTDVAAIFFGLKIYPENIRAGIDDPAVRSLLSGTFLIVANDAGAQKQQLELSLELAPGQGPLSEDQERLVAERIRWHMISTNIEYRKLVSTLDPQVTAPSIHFYTNGDLSPMAVNRSSQATAFFGPADGKPRTIL
jgi:phenylacetate-CoA ligase